MLIFNRQKNNQQQILNISSRLVVSLFYFFKNLQLHISVILVICTNIGLIFCADDIIATHKPKIINLHMFFTIDIITISHY